MAKKKNMFDLYKELSHLTDNRRKQGKRHPVDLVVILVILGIMNGYDGYRAIGDFIVRNREELEQKIGEAVMESKGRPVILDHFLENALEVDVDVLCDAKRVSICGVMEQVEEAGVHSGDSACVLPAQNISPQVLRTIKDYSEKLALALEVKGLCNLQMAVKGGKVFVLEVNPRASRTVPFVSKATGFQIAKIAAKIQIGKTLDELGVPQELAPKMVSVKMPVFPFNKFPDADPAANAEMKSTGEVMAIAPAFNA